MSLASRVTAIVAATAALLGAGVGPVATAPATVTPVTTNEPQPSQPSRDLRDRQYVPLAGARPAVEETSPSTAGPTAFEAVRWCESRDSYTAKNRVSSASGAFQFINSTWTAVTGLEPPASAYPREVQDAAFHKLWADGAGAHHWNPSRSCWAPMIGAARG